MNITVSSPSLTDPVEAIVDMTSRGLRRWVTGRGVGALEENRGCTRPFALSATGMVRWWRSRSGLSGVFYQAKCKYQNAYIDSWCARHHPNGQFRAMIKTQCANSVEPPPRPAAVKTDPGLPEEALGELQDWGKIVPPIDVRDARCLGGDHVARRTVRQVGYRHVGTEGSRELGAS